MKKSKKLISLELSEELIERLKKLSIKRELSVSAIIRLSIQEYLINNDR